LQLHILRGFNALHLSPILSSIFFQDEESSGKEFGAFRGLILRSQLIVLLKHKVIQFLKGVVLVDSIWARLIPLSMAFDNYVLSISKGFL
jgi:hypothetical protein